MSARGTRIRVALAVAVGLAAASAGSGAARAQNEELEAAEQPPLRVAVAGSPPFVVGDNGTDGLAIDIWTAVAGELGVAFELTAADSVEDAIDAVASGRADVAVGPISITDERARRVAFTQPYYQSHLSIAAPPEQSWFDRIRPFLTVAFLSGIGGLLLVLLIVGTLVWLAERRVSPEDFPQRPSAGIGNGVWMALVTMTTVGYGDRVPRTTAGRIITGIWMLIAMLIAGSLIAFMSTALTMSQLGAGALNSAEDLRNERVGVVEGTTSETLATRIGARPIATPSVEAAVETVTSGRAAAVVFDRPALQYHLRSHPDADLVLAEARYEPTGYGFAIALDSPLRQSLDVAILGLQRTGRLTTVVERWLGGG